MTHLRQSDLRPILFTLFMALELALPRPVLVLATDLPPSGNTGGNAFRAECPKGAYLVGLQGKAGEWVDRVATLCAPWLHASQAFGSASVGPSFGDSRGGNVTFGNCNKGNIRNQAVLSVSVTLIRGNNPFVNNVAAQCIALGTPAPPSNFVFGSSSPPSGSLLKDPTVGPWKQTCPAGEVASGIHGRAGLFLDAVGLICRPFPPKPPLPFESKVNPNAIAPSQGPASLTPPSTQQSNSSATPMRRSPSVIMPRGVDEQAAPESNQTVEQSPEPGKKQ